jgi:hypothetical protein
VQEHDDGHGEHDRDDVADVLRDAGRLDQRLEQVGDGRFGQRAQAQGA